MYHPTSRVLAVLELLQSHGRLSGAQIAARLEIDTRSVRRYIAVLEEIGIPIMSERGRFGGYALMPGFKLPPMMFSDDEALALSIGLLAARSLGLSEAGPAAASAQAKIERTMPEPLRQRVRAVSDMVRLDVARAQAPADNDVLVTLSSAAQAQQCVELDYRAKDNTQSTRRFDPYGLALRAGCWYAVGRCHLRADLRSFRIDRIGALKTIGQSFLRPAGFDTMSHLTLSLATIPRAHALAVLLKAELKTVQAHFFDAIGVFTQTEDGVLMRGATDDLDWFARQLACLPFAFEIIQPAPLRDALRRCAVQLLEQLDGAARSL